MLDDYLVEIVSLYYSAGMMTAASDISPVTDGYAFRLWTVEGDLIAEVTKHEDSGRYALTGDPMRLLYREWQGALADGSKLTADEISRLDVTESYE